MRLATCGENWCLRSLILALDRVHWVLGETGEAARICHGKKSEHGRAYDCMSSCQSRYWPASSPVRPAPSSCTKCSCGGKTVISIGQGWNWTGGSGEVQPWRTNLSKIGEVSRKVLLPLLGAVRLRKKCPSGFPFSIWKYQSCGLPRRVYQSSIRLSSIDMLARI